MMHLIHARKKHHAKTSFITIDGPRQHQPHYQINHSTSSDADSGSDSGDMSVIEFHTNVSTA